MSKLVVVVGPTGSGKSALGLKLAQQFNGEIINADSRAVYRYMDVGTAKPTDSEMLLIPHHLVNIKNPDEQYSAAEFKAQALAAIEEISSRHKLAIMVGGTGLYIDSVLFDYRFPPAADPAVRSKLSELSLDELVRRLQKLDPEAALEIDLRNPRRVIRAIELAGQAPRKSAGIRPDTLVIGMSLSKESIQKRLAQRLENMLSKGLISEVEHVGEQFGWNSEAMSALAYRVYKNYILGSMTLDEANTEFTKQELNLAKRQMTWFKRNKDITWLNADELEQLLEQAETLVREFLLKTSYN